MRKTLVGTLFAAVAIIIAGCAVTYPTAEVAAGAEIFNKCKACHSANPSKGTFGPSLTGVYMRQAGTLYGFDYSEELTNAMFVWDDEHLRKWVAHNKMVLKGTRMRHVSITDPVEQDYLIAYLRYISDYPKKMK
ncbi:MAG: c-type cytochrome [Alphaproteobacteria bacterium]|nr:c-type cytochrome [Rhodospirillales bacterium]MCW9045444.1 c-type cytochrome [Alphaproteobacteria bacterium]